MREFDRQVTILLLCSPHSIRWRLGAYGVCAASEEVRASGVRVCCCCQIVVERVVLFARGSVLPRFLLASSFSVGGENSRLGRPWKGLVWTGVCLCPRVLVCLFHCLRSVGHALCGGIRWERWGCVRGWWGLREVVKGVCLVGVFVCFDFAVWE